MSQLLDQPAAATPTERKASVMIGVPTNGDMKMLTVFSLVMATNMLRSLGHDMTFTAREGPYTHWNREHLANDAVEAGCDYLMFVDTDIVFPAEAIPRLISHEKDIVGGMYNLKQDKPVSTIKLWRDGEGPDDFSYGMDDLPFHAADDEPLPAGLFRVAALPTGFMLIDVQKVLVEAMSFPFFPCDFMLGEDVAFCVNAQKAGCEVWCDPTIQLQHVGNKAY